MNHLSTVDKALTQRFRLALNSHPWRWARLTAHLGDGPFVFGGLGLFFFFYVARPDNYARRSILIITLVTLITMVVVTTIKFAVRRERPNPPGEFVTFKYDAYSFPSGHSARLAALVVSSAFFAPKLGWALVPLALGVATARVAVGIHYIFDIIAGLIVGAAVAWGVLHLLLTLSPILAS